LRVGGRRLSGDLKGGAEAWAAVVEGEEAGGEGVRGGVSK
jgi:hypothetical protein